MIIRNATANDAHAICNIYNYYVLNTAITFETTAVSVEEMQRRIQEVLNNRLPYFIAEIDHNVLGYCYLHRWNNRCAYSSTKEVSIYLDKDVRRQGIGEQLFGHLLKNINLYDQTHVLISGICIPNEASVHLHEKFGFKQISHMREIGRKFDEWHDVGHWELILSHPKRILVLCIGNSCRSQMAHGFLESFDHNMNVFSAGTNPATKVNEAAVKVMLESGIDISNHTPHHVNEYLDKEWDYVITVCGDANETCPTFSGRVTHRLHIGFHDPSETVGSPQFIENEFRRIRDEIKNKLYQFYISNIK